MTTELTASGPQLNWRQTAIRSTAPSWELLKTGSVHLVTLTVRPALMVRQLSEFSSLPRRWSLRPFRVLKPVASFRQRRLLLSAWSVPLSVTSNSSWELASTASETRIRDWRIHWRDFGSTLSPATWVFQGLSGENGRLRIASSPPSVGS